MINYKTIFHPLIIQIKFGIMDCFQVSNKGTNIHICHNHFDANGTSNAMFDELAERSLMSPLAGMKHTYVRLAI